MLRLCRNGVTFARQRATNNQRPTAIIMKHIFLISLAAMAVLSLHAQTERQTALPQVQPTADDPVIMTINGQPVLRSEFEYSYNKNNSEGVIDRKTVEDYLPLFVNYKLKVAAALDERLDTTASFINEFVTYRDQQVRPTFITDADVEAKARAIYDDTRKRVEAGGGLFNCAHIFFKVAQQQKAEGMQSVQARADSVYALLNNGEETFEALAAKYSEDPNSKIKGGELGWAQPGTFFPEFENVALALKDGEVSKVIKSPAGLHIVKMLGRQPMFAYDSVREDIIRFIDARNLREAIINDKLNNIAKTTGNTTVEQLVDERAWELQNQDADVRNLIREYHDGLLFFEISNREVWEKANSDEKALENFFIKNKKNYTWDAPRFKGMVYHVKDKATEKAVKKSVKKIDFEQWKETLRTTFNNDSVIRIRVELGRFKAGDNTWVDHKVFKKPVTPEKNNTYPIENVFGRLLKAPENYQDVRSQVITDYQDWLEKQWVEQLRKKYPVEIRQEVVNTVNQH